MVLLSILPCCVVENNKEENKMTSKSLYITDEQRVVLDGWVQKDIIDLRMYIRAFIILSIAAGEKRLYVASILGVNPCIVTKWKRRFVAHGIEGLFDRPRSGRPHKYNDDTERKILSILEKRPPQGHSHWNRFSIAKELGDVSAHQVWLVMRKNKISLGSKRRKNFAHSDNLLQVYANAKYLE